MSVPFQGVMGKSFPQIEEQTSLLVYLVPAHRATVIVDEVLVDPLEGTEGNV